MEEEEGRAGGIDAPLEESPSPSSTIPAPLRGGKSGTEEGGRGGAKGGGREGEEAVELVVAVVVEEEDRAAPGEVKVRNWGPEKSLIGSLEG